VEHAARTGAYDGGAEFRHGRICGRGAGQVGRRTRIAPFVPYGRLQVVFGTGQVGLTLATRLADMGFEVRAVSRHRPAGLTARVNWQAADVTDPEAALAAANGAAVVYQCLNTPYTQWPERFPPLQRNVLRATERNHALLVSLENSYGTARPVENR
jgi:hypothetical protein